ncbi:MAG: sulfatase [Chthonomonadales bacterium]|nr:sulfatase [Chthonomonadales bacterium]
MPVFQRLALATAAAVLCCAPASAPVASQQVQLSASQAQPLRGRAAQRPNVLIILADDLGWSDVGCYGSEIRTPNLDALASDGLRYTQFYNSARCSPSRASLLTGLNPHQVGVPVLSTALNDRCVTLAEVLKPAGYHTYMVGKWHLSEQNTPIKRGFEEFYGMLGGFNTYWKEDPFYTRLPADHPKRTYRPDAFYSSNVFGDYAIDFMQQGRDSGQPWFLYLAFNAAHFPLGAPEEAIQKYETMYRTKGWDAIRTERLARQKQLGLVPANLVLTPRSVVPSNFINRQTGWADKENPAWDSLPPDRQADLARRMAVYAAAIEIMDRNIGRIVAYLKGTGEWNNTLICFLSDNGACAEWDPYGFDKLDSPLNILHKGEELKKVGGPDSYVSYGSGWANASNTPWRLYKHYAQEGGIRTPMIVHWPAGLNTRPGATNASLGYVTDFMPTLLDVCDANYPQERNGVNILPVEGESLTPTFQGAKLSQRVLCVEHEGNRMVRGGDWKLVALANRPWELYDLKSDPTEMYDRAATEPTRVQRLSEAWETWAVRCHVKPPESPQIAGQPLTIRCDVTPLAPHGVILAQGGNKHGYALSLQAGKPIFSVREDGKLTAAVAPEIPIGRFTLEARLEKNGSMTLAVNSKIVAHAQASGLIAVQPQDALSIGEDTLSAVGDYNPPHPLKGTVENVVITAGIKRYSISTSPTSPRGKSGLSERND